MKDIKIAFFGTPDFSVVILDELNKAGIKPALIVTGQDKPQGRKLVVTPPPVKIWATENSVNFSQPEKLDNDFIEWIKIEGFDLFIVAAYGKIIPKDLLAIPKHGSLNVHPSLLPRFRGASPIESQILADEKKVGVSIMLLDEKMDHGPILASENYEPENWPPRASRLEIDLAHVGGKVLSRVLMGWVNGDIAPVEQDHQKATYTKKITKADGLLDLSEDPLLNLRKIRAYDGWPGTYFYTKRKGRDIRVLVKDAKIEDEKLVITKVLPEGGKEMSYEDLLKGL
jgi:methionyl-tRNA formyltransferase